MDHGQMLSGLLAHLVHAWVVCIGTLLCGLGLIAMAFLALPLCVVLRFFPKAAADNEDLWYLHYGMAMRVYDRANPCSIRSQFIAFLDESTEFVEATTALRPADMLDELGDVFHTIGRLVMALLVSLPLVGAAIEPVVAYLPLIGWATARKHTLRYLDYGCIRSERNCQKGKCGVCPSPKNNPQVVPALEAVGLVLTAQGNRMVFK